MESSYTVTINGLQTFLYQEGAGEPILMLHGMTATSECWRYTFDAFKDDYCVIAPDLPGYGRSAARNKPYSLELYVAWVDSLLDTLGLEKAILMGSSMGGAISLAYAMTHSQKVTHLVMVDALGMSEDLPWRSARTLLNRVPHLLALALTNRFDPHLFRYLQNGVVSNPQGKPRDIVLTMAKLNRPHGIWLLWTGMRVLLVDFLLPSRRRAFVEKLGTIDIPTLIAWGKQDALLPVKDAFFGAEHMPAAHVKIFEHSAHVPMMEEPEVFNETLQSFLTGKEKTMI